MISSKLTQSTIVGMALALGVLSSPVLAQATDHGKAHAANAAATETIDGEIKKVDKSAKKLTIKHGEIKSLEMPGMTMVFQVKDPAMLDQVKAGDKVRFKTEKGNGGFVVTELQPAGK